MGNDMAEATAEDASEEWQKPQRKTHRSGGRAAYDVSEEWQKTHQRKQDRRTFV